jgi:diguanylate cyclase (GGDEF)-like protein
VESVRTSDCVARYGGEEFALVLIETPITTARPVVERIRSRVEQENWGAVSPGLTVTLSLGIAELKKDEHHEALLHRADELLYVAKRRGKNRVVAQGDE